MTSIDTCGPNILYKYPLSSCDTYNCGTFEDADGNKCNIPTNMSVCGCTYEDGWKCYDRKLFRRDRQPECKDGARYKHLNKQLGIKYNPRFVEVECDGKKQYTARDARLVSAPRASRLTLDRPPYTGDVALKDIYNPSFQEYGKRYSSYNDIKTGQILYYIDNEIADAFYQPVYDIPTDVEAVMYKDPMDNMKPQYNRKWTGKDDCVSGGWKCNEVTGCLSEISDRNSHIEDITARQQLRNNQQKWSARWQ